MLFQSFKMQVLIYRPAKNAMQSGVGSAKRWVLEYQADSKTTIDPLMGWVGGSDTQRQVKLFFKSCAEAVDYARRMGYHYQIKNSSDRCFQIKNYADNFAWNKIEFGRA